jgi:glycosyltransferase involved in cell wall biosynthesis
MKLLLISPYHGGSHRAWAEGYGRFSKHDVRYLTMPARFWKWRMHGGAVTLARRFNETGQRPDLIIATDMLDLTTFLSLTRPTLHHTPIVLYMHENQLTYPLPADKSSGPMRRQLGERDRHYAFINYSSMLAADQVWFNSRFHFESFFSALPNFLKHFPEYNELGSVEKLRNKCEVMPIGIDFKRLDSAWNQEQPSSQKGHRPLILWNQRWEYDKNPASFFSALDILAQEGLPYQVAICGQQFGKKPLAFEEGIEQLGKRVAHFGYVDAETYARLLWKSDVTVSTAHHEFFGISILEAIYSNTFPILPDRLSYPELLPPEFHQSCLYSDFEGLVDRLREALVNVQESRRLATALSKKITVYDWAHVAPRYDARLASLIDQA